MKDWREWGENVGSEGDETAGTALVKWERDDGGKTRWGRRNGCRIDS